MRRSFWMAIMIPAVAGCAAAYQTSSPAGPAAPTPAAPAAAVDQAAVTDTLGESQTCGIALGIAVQCGFVADADDLGNLRTVALANLVGDRPPSLTARQVTTAFDAGALGAIETVQRCDGAATPGYSVARTVELRLMQCAGQLR